MGPVVLFATVSPDYPEGAALIPGALVNNIGLGGVAPADVWLTAARAVLGPDVSVTILTNAMHYKFWERWVAAQSGPAPAIINSGQTRGDLRTSRADVFRGLRVPPVDADVMFVLPVDVSCPPAAASAILRAAASVTMDMAFVGGDGIGVGFARVPAAKLLDVESVHAGPAPWQSLFAAAECIPLPAIGDTSSLSIAPPAPLIPALPADAIHHKAHARVGIMGNPSDGFNGKTVAATIVNFWAEAWIWPTTGPLELIPHPLYDAQIFLSLQQCSRVADASRCHKFFKHVTARDPAIALVSNFCLTYHTNVPRQVGLAGSSALIVSMLQCLIDFFGLRDKLASLQLDPPRFAAFVLSIETEELGIAAGLQDRVAQTYEGCVFMDFARSWFDTRGYGEYVAVPPALLPPLFLAYCPDPKDSGKVHSPVKQRWLDGDVTVIEGMGHLGNLAKSFYDLIRRDGVKPWDVAHETAALMRENFATRLRLYGDAVVGPTNARMIGIAAECGTAAKLPGSGGAAVGVVDVIGMARKLGVECIDGLTEVDWRSQVNKAYSLLQAAYEAAGFVFVPISVHCTSA